MGDAGRGQAAVIAPPAADSNKAGTIVRKKAAKNMKSWQEGSAPFELSMMKNDGSGFSHILDLSF
jgi:hypothetical protein